MPGRVLLSVSLFSLACQQGLICLMHCHNLWGLDDVQCWFSHSSFFGSQPTNMCKIVSWSDNHPGPKNACVKQAGKIINTNQKQFLHLSYHWVQSRRDIEVINHVLLSWNYSQMVQSSCREWVFMVGEVPNGCKTICLFVHALHLFQ